jgi:hypothetical protein
MVRSFRNRRKEKEMARIKANGNNVLEPKETTDYAANREKLAKNPDIETIYAKAKQLAPTADIAVLSLDTVDSISQQIISVLPSNLKPTIDTTGKKISKTGRYCINLVCGREFLITLLERIQTGLHNTDGNNPATSGVVEGLKMTLPPDSFYAVCMSHGKNLSIHKYSPDIRRQQGTVAKERVVREQHEDDEYREGSGCGRSVVAPVG